MAFFRTYREVTPPSCLVWTNERGEDGEMSTTVTFFGEDDKTLLVMHDVYSSKDALDAAIASGATGAMPKRLDQLDAFLGSFGMSLEDV